MKPQQIRVKPYLAIALFCLLSQLSLIYVYRPTANDFQPSRTISGKYEEGGLGAGAQNISKVNGEAIYCGHGYLGPSSPCISSYRGDDVVVQLVSYRSFYLQKEAVQEIRSTRHESLLFTRSQMVRGWWTSSMFTLVPSTLLLLGALGGIYYLIFDRKRK